MNEIYKHPHIFCTHISLVDGHTAPLSEVETQFWPNPDPKRGITAQTQYMPWLNN